ncbi:glycine-rich RNA-binding protein 4, mitochondrial-like isoform X3 [Papaver somniferum]|uniref:glycine-rich RNA-binding protein 4, mitochondrial-like isoform X3 n=1 Tax=Papaver somniferum TaxID=3469 RepID=UPI000E704445|nr:glycine-rich RNA-binding protein 4, mitochondrial-like isoform X3 [Papaver somniferum]
MAKQMKCSSVPTALKAFPLARLLITRQACSKLFIGGLSHDTNEPVLKEAFEQHGEIIEGDHRSGKSKGYGFVQFMSEKSASTALEELNGQLLDGRNIRVFYANKDG